MEYASERDKICSAIEKSSKSTICITWSHTHTHTRTHVKRAGLGSLSKKKDEANSFEERWTDGRVRDNERNTYGLV